MRRLVDPAARRLSAALLTATGVFALAAGALGSASPLDRLPDTSVGSASPGATDPGAGWFIPTFPPLEASAGPLVGASVSPNDRVATRVVIESLGIDLPVIAPPSAGYPPCNVALELQDPRLGQPGSGRSTYVYAHARTGMFLPLLTEVQRNGGKGLIDLTVDVYTSDDLEFVYRITRVLPDVPPNTHFLDRAIAATSETLWLQTSTGPNATYPKLQVIAQPWTVLSADQADAHPVPHPVVCG